METPNVAALAPANLPKIDEELTFGVLKSQPRRKLLVALACGGPQAGADLKLVGKGRGRVRGQNHLANCALMHLKKIVAAGIVVKLDHGTDGRRVFYSVSPLVKVTRYGNDTEFDFGFVIALLAVDGN
jgi:hypothetical protein